MQRQLRRLVLHYREAFSIRWPVTVPVIATDTVPGIVQPAVPVNLPMKYLTNPPGSPARYTCGIGDVTGSSDLEAY